jgi:hypothetical protein
MTRTDEFFDHTGCSNASARHFFEPEFDTGFFKMPPFKLTLAL